MSKLAMVLLTLLAGGASCGSPAAPTDHQTLAAARALWSAKSGPAYSYQVTRSCECLLSGQVSVIVVDGAVASAVYVNSGSPVGAALLSYVLTVPDLFDLIQDALDRNASYLAVTYDPTYGYPTRIQVDYSASAVDDELLLTVRDLTFAPAQ